jgi:sugar phosphate isomerase/epimerase
MLGMHSMNRRTFLATSFGAAAAASAAPPPKLKLSVFTKHLQFLKGPDALAEAIASMGFDGADVALRKGGTIEPERARDEFPKLIKALESRGVATPMITSGIVDAESPFAEPVLAVLKDQGIKYYRWGGFRYDYKQPLAPQLEAAKPRVAKLAELNRKYGVCAIYHTHSGLNQIGASIWDIREILKDFDPAQVAINYDVGHATVEGGWGGWVNSFHISGKHLRGIALKDFVWMRPKPRPQWCPVGEGMVNFPEFFSMVAKSGFSGPLQVHYEFPLGGAESGKTEINIAPEKVFAAMKKDLVALRGMMQQAGL